MGKILENLHFTLLIGLVLAIVVIGAVVVPGSHADMIGAEQAVLRWLHLFFGITWIGLLYYFNFVQIPTMPKVPAELKKGVTGYIAPSALFFFRWGAALTVLTGLVIAWRAGWLVTALSLDPAARLIGIGMWLALVMAFNVWFIIWPNQKKALGLVEADDATKAKSARTAMLTSRINTLLSIPMLYCMINFS